MCVYVCTGQIQFIWYIYTTEHRWAFDIQPELCIALSVEVCCSHLSLSLSLIISTSPLIWCFTLQAEEKRRWVIMNYGTAQSCFENRAIYQGSLFSFISQSLVSRLRGGTCLSAWRRAGESMGVWDMAGAGEPPRGDSTSWGGLGLSLGMVGDELLMPG